MKLPLTFIIDETYQIADEESIEAGGFSDQGYNYEDEPYTIDEIKNYLENEGFIHPSSSALSSKNDYITNNHAEDHDFFTKGEQKTKTIHLKDIKDADGQSLPDETQSRFWVSLLNYQISNDNDKEMDSFDY
jgi:hypothetical protein